MDIIYKQYGVLIECLPLEVVKTYVCIVTVKVKLRRNFFWVSCFLEYEEDLTHFKPGLQSQVMAISYCFFRTVLFLT